MKSTYPYKQKLVVSPLKNFREVYNVRNTSHPIREIITKSVGTINFTAVIEEDTQTLALFRHIPGLVAFLCSLQRNTENGPEIISQGRGTAVLNSTNRYIEKTVKIACNASILDSVAKATRAFDSIGLSTTENSAISQNKAVIEPSTEINQDLATEKQKSYLLNLIDTHVSDEDDRSRWEDRISGLTRADANEAIQSFAR